MFPCIVADIGGTNARFALVTSKTHCARGFRLGHQKNYFTADFASFDECFASYIAELAVAPEYACLAVAGPIVGDWVNLTNNHWAFSIATIKTQFALKQFAVINDFAAQAACLPHLDATALLAVHVPAQTSVDTTAKPLGVVGPGTGFGVAGLMPAAGGWYVVASEGGHCAFAPQTPREVALAAVLREKLVYLSWEDLLSGRGIVNIYQALLQVDGIASGDVDASSPQSITDAALQQFCLLADEALTIFCQILADACADVALIYGARGGVYLTGGILPRIQSILLRSGFSERFTSKGAASTYLADIPVSLILQEDPGLIGAAAWMDQLTSTHYV